MEEYEDIIHRTNQARQELEAKNPPTEEEKKIYEKKCSETVLLKFLTSMEYGIEDVNEVLEQIETTTGEKVSYIAASNLDTLKVEYEKKKSGPLFPLYIIYLTPMDRVWILAAIITHEDKTKVLYKDPSGTKVDDELRAFFKEKLKIDGENVLINDAKTEGKLTSDYRDMKDYSGPITIRNMLKIHHECTTEPSRNNLITQFKTREKLFLTPSFLDADKKLLVISIATQFASSSNPFLSALKLQVKNMKTAVNSYDTKVEQFDSYLRANKNENITYIQLKEERDKHFPSGNLEETTKKLNKTAKEKKPSDEDKEAVSFFDSIGEEYPTEMATLKLICTILGGCVSSKEVDGTLQQLNFILGMPTTWLTKLMDLQDLKKHYQTFKESMKKVDAYTPNDVKNWVKRNERISKSEQDVCDALAVVNRALNLKTGFYMRYPQICACLLMLLTGNRDNGKLLQIKTGEGKTVTVGVMAIILVLQGHKVDVITSNNVLANEGVAGTCTWTNLMGISVGSNKYEASPEATDKVDEELMKKCPFTGQDKTELCKNWLERVKKYKHDIVYGAISNFQFDYLKDRAENQNERKKRPFDYLILDEVDNMLIDNGGHIAKLAEPFPGMESLRYVYMNIWTALNRLWKGRLKDLEKEAKAELDRLGKDETKTTQEISQEFKAWVKKNTKLIDEITEGIKGTEPWNIAFIPSHIKNYAEKKIDQLIEMACFAKWGAAEDENYIIQEDPTDPDREPKIVPVDNENTGVILDSTIWSYGLHQFVQLKHNLRLTFESLTSSYISNVGYIKKYTKNPDQHKSSEKNYPTRIFGVTGTFGGIHEQELLRKIYALEFVEIPPYRESQLIRQKEKFKIVTDESWPDAVAVESFMEAKERGVLVICNSIKDVELIADCCKTLGKLGTIGGKH